MRFTGQKLRWYTNDLINTPSVNLKISFWHHGLNGQEFEQALGVDDGQGSLLCSSPWGLEELDTTEQLD